MLNQPQRTSFETNLDLSKGFTAEQVDLIKNQIAPGFSDNELKLFMSVCLKTGLDPFTRQIYAFKIKNKNGEKISIQTSIDGFRLIAERSDRYEGQVGPFWCGGDGLWKDVWTAKETPFAAKVGVFKRGWREPLFAVAHFRAYAKTNYTGQLEAMWARMPELMISKCAEALALRKAFPNEMSGIYTEDEMSSVEKAEKKEGEVKAVVPQTPLIEASVSPSPVLPPVTVPPLAKISSEPIPHIMGHVTPTPAQLGRFEGIRKAAGVPLDAVTQYVELVYGRKSVSQLERYIEYKIVCDELENGSFREKYRAVGIELKANDSDASKIAVIAPKQPERPQPKPFVPEPYDEAAWGIPAPKATGFPLRPNSHTEPQAGVRPQDAELILPSGYTDDQESQLLSDYSGEEIPW